MHHLEFKKEPRNTCKSGICKIYQEWKHLIAILSSLPYRIGITFNCWEDLNINHYLCITIHYIVDEWCT